MGRRVGARKAAAAKIDEDSPLDVELLKREDEIRTEVKKRCNDIKKAIKKAQDELEAVLAEQLEAIPEEFLSMPIAEYLARFGSEVDDEERIEMEKFAQTSGASAPAGVQADATCSAGVAETPSIEQSGTTVVRGTRTRTRTATKAEADPKVLMPPPPPVTDTARKRGRQPPPPPPTWAESERGPSVSPPSKRQVSRTRAGGKAAIAETPVGKGPHSVLQTPANGRLAVPHTPATGLIIGATPGTRLRCRMGPGTVAQTPSGAQTIKRAPKQGEMLYSATGSPVMAIEEDDELGEDTAGATFISEVLKGQLDSVDLSVVDAMPPEEQEKALGEFASISQKVQSFMSYLMGRKK